MTQGRSLRMLNKPRRRPKVAWLKAYSETAATSDRFSGQDDHEWLIALGLFGEAGSVLAEVKKMRREAKAYPAYADRLTEELGDFLWYFVRLLALCCPEMIGDIESRRPRRGTLRNSLPAAIALGCACGDVLRALQGARDRVAATEALRSVWIALAALTTGLNVDLKAAADRNLLKTQSRWPIRRSSKLEPTSGDYHPLFDQGNPVEERLPRKLAVEFMERKSRGSREVLLRCNGINIGSRVTDNIVDPDFYRYHDIFHIAHAVFTGWSPVLRALYRCKRKSQPSIDENQDGARAIIVEEAITALVFSRAKNMAFFEGALQLDYDLLKLIQELVRGYEVEIVPAWQWERGILTAYGIFRKLRDHGGGRVAWDIMQRKLTWVPLADSRGHNKL